MSSKHGVDVVEYMRLSLDAVHCSVTALGRHLSGEPVQGRASLTVSVEARTSPAELLGTVLHACRALTGVMVGAGHQCRRHSVRLLCHADLDAGAPTETARGCMVLKEYTLVQKDQAEEVRAALCRCCSTKRHA